LVNFSSSAFVLILHWLLGIFIGPYIFLSILLSKYLSLLAQTLIHNKLTHHHRMDFFWQCNGKHTLNSDWINRVGWHSGTMPDLCSGASSSNAGRWRQRRDCRSVTEPQNLEC
jgi:hypothetical protein